MVVRETIFIRDRLAYIPTRAKETSLSHCTVFDRLQLFADQVLAPIFFCVILGFHDKSNSPNLSPQAFPMLVTIKTRPLRSKWKLPGLLLSPIMHCGNLFSDHYPEHQ